MDTPIPAAPAADLRSMQTGVILQSPAQMFAEQDQNVSARRAAEDKIIPQLAAEIQKRLQTAVRAKRQKVDLDLLADERQRAGEYDPETASKIKLAGGSDIYDNVTETQAAAGEAAIADVLLFHDDDRPWGLNATELPDLPPDAVAHVAQELASVVQAAMQETGQPPTPDAIVKLATLMEDQLKQRLVKEAEKRALGMETKIAKIFEEGGFRQAFYDFLTDFLTFRSAFLRGPVLRMMDQPLWGRSPDGRMLPQMHRKLKLCIERVSPFDAFPDPSSIEINDGGFRLRRMLSRRDVETMKGAPGSLDANITTALASMDTGSGRGIKNWMFSDAARALLELNLQVTQVYVDRWEVCEFWEWFTGKMLNDFYTNVGVPAEAVYDPDKSYPMWGVMLGDHVLKLVRNYDPRGHVPIYKSSFRKVPGSFWGKSLPQLIREDQKAINALSRASLTNAGLCARANKAVDKDRLVPGQNVNSCQPGEVILTQKNGGHTTKPVEYFSPQMVAPQLMELRNGREQKIFDKSGFQPYNLGDGRGEQGAGATLGGFSILVGLQSKTAKKAVFNIDQDVTRPLVLAFWWWVMLYDADESIKGDVEVVARGAFALFVREAEAEKRMKWLQLTNNPVDLQIIGMRGRAGNLRKTAQALRIDAEDIPTDEEMRAREEQAESAAKAQAAQPDGGAAPQQSAAHAAGPAAARPRPAGQEGAPDANSPTGRTLTNQDLIESSLASSKQAKLQAETELLAARAAAITTKSLVDKALAVARLEHMASGVPEDGLR